MCLSSTADSFQLNVHQTWPSIQSLAGETNSSNNYIVHHLQSLLNMISMKASPALQSSLMQQAPRCFRRCIDYMAEQVLCKGVKRRSQELLRKINTGSAFPLLYIPLLIFLVWRCSFATQKTTLNNTGCQRRCYQHQLLLMPETNSTPFYFSPTLILFEGKQLSLHSNI